jgi:hypothetical protein
MAVLRRCHDISIEAPRAVTPLLHWTALRMHDLGAKQLGSLKGEVNEPGLPPAYVFHG